jgi:hemerythrin-like metal-binding protein
MRIKGMLMNDRKINELLKWNEEKMSVGNDIIDNQHKELLIIINELVNSIKEETQMKGIESIIERLIQNVKIHFRTEESLFSNLIDEKDIEQHKKEHEHFENMINEINHKIKTDNKFKERYAIETLTQLFLTLSNWFLHHDIYKDKNFFKQSESK